jgi:2-dehydro-3-deoxyphosphogluconate aldolase / (4S)-4-hydroxy-2-oxoglutarate aldolase
LIPTGGVTLQNAAEFIAAGALAVGVGADLVKGTPSEITEKARQYVQAVGGERPH